MIYVGTDIVDVSRIQALIDDWPKRFIERVFTSGEVSYCNRQVNPSIHFAGRFAAKEAARKALFAAGRGRTIPFIDIDVRRSELGVPSLEIPDTGNFQIALSMSHTDSLATATVLVESNG